MTEGRPVITPRKGSVGNPLTEADMPFKVEEDGCYWIKLDRRDLTQLPFSPAGSTLEVRVDRIV